MREIDENIPKEMFDQFNTNKKAILISTDVAARGLDFPLIDWVIHYDVNPDIKEYVNRMGRTARLDHIGNSLIFLMQNEQVLLDTCLLSVKPKMKEIVSSDILLEFVNKVNKNILKTPIELKPMPFSQEVDENENIVFDGEWKDDKKNGNGQLVNGAVKYSGSFQE